MISRILLVNTPFQPSLFVRAVKSRALTVIGRFRIRDFAKERLQ